MKLTSELWKPNIAETVKSSLSASAVFACQLQKLLITFWNLLYCRFAGLCVHTCVSTPDN